MSEPSLLTLTAAASGPDLAPELALNGASPLLAVRGLTQRYRSRGGSVLAFEAINLQVQPREVVCLLGPSGCGKSSLLLAIAGLQPAERGNVWLHGQAIAEPHPSVSLMFQGPALLPWLTVAQNVAWGLHLRRMPRLGRAEARSRVAEALTGVGLGGREHAYPHQLSGGMAQRVALARALVRQPELLLLDEPFSALDAITRRSMQELLRRAIDRHRAAALLVTHDIDEALALGDRVVLMDRCPGRIRRQWIVRSPHQTEGDRPDPDPNAQAEMRREILEELFTVMDFVSPTGGAA